MEGMKRLRSIPLSNGDKAFDGFRTAIRSVEIPARAMGVAPSCGEIGWPALRG